MATYSQTVNRIIDDLSRNDTSITAVVQSHMQDAIARYTPIRFWFNEARTSFSTTVSTAYYNLPTDFLNLDSLNVLINGRKVQLDPIGFHEMDRMDVGGYVGYPILFTTFAEQWRLYPVPNGPYSVDVFYQKKLATLSATSDTNAWTTEAQSLIRAATMKTLYGSKFKDYDAAQAMGVLEQQELDALLNRTEAQLGSGVLQGDL